MRSLHLPTTLLDEKTLPELTELEYEIYKRQIPLPGFGSQGQRQLKGSSVMISRVGGVGGTVALELARAGVGRLVLAHEGVIELENLNRMLLAFRQDVGRPRVEAFRDMLARVNPEVDVLIEADNIHANNAERLIDQVDLIVDGSPSFEERYHMNQEAVRQRKPIIMAAMFGLEMYITTMIPGSTPCLSCLYPTPPPSWEVTGFPVILPSSALVATIATMEVIKVITGCGEPLINRLFYGDLTSNGFRQLHIARRRDCPICGHLVSANEGGAMA
ncbi:adenylyltransferase [Reticulibacter mediterranei]|uniref:Adenylyltransferase n=1 Tax=Reticulibacter mediterranei TaxID=2778369 RepID=A0A8J3IN81_9CHLR|nr:HesA/MoeB/ThiF family protein [Reticulibacter mediterranei]GHO94654.1 adenylyltransferase [Reticulibacter mediterranei]